MKNLFILIVLTLCFSNVYGVMSHYKADPVVGEKISNFHPAIQKMTINDFLTMTPKEYKRLTGKRMGVKNFIAFKVAKSAIKKRMKRSSEPTTGTYIIAGVLVIIAIALVAALLPLLFSLAIIALIGLGAWYLWDRYYA